MEHTLDLRADQSAEEPKPSAARPGKTRLLTTDNAVLGGILVALSASFYYGWFLDDSHPLGGDGWSDQRNYIRAANRMFDGHLPTKADLHFDPFYSFLGAAGTLLSRHDPFWLVSYLLLIGSAIFLYKGASRMLGPVFAVIFMVMLFAWDGFARTFAYASELFTIPWNNQLLFFAYAFFFWLYVTKARGKVDPKWMIVMGVICGALATTREESALFLGPLAAFYLIYRKASVRIWIYTAVAALATAAPTLYIKWQVLGSPFAVGPGRPGDSYTGTAGGYFSLRHLVDNINDVIVNSNHAPAAANAQRHALLQSSPWFWIAPIGICILLFSARSGWLVKWYIVMSGVLAGFYLSGDNVSAAKLKFHCLRYLSPAFIVLALGSTVVLSTLWDFVKPDRKPKVSSDPPSEAATAPDTETEAVLTDDDGPDEPQPVGTSATYTENVSR